MTHQGEAGEQEAGADGRRTAGEGKRRWRREVRDRLDEAGRTTSD